MTARRGMLEVQRPAHQSERGRADPGTENSTGNALVRSQRAREKAGTEDGTEGKIKGGKEPMEHKSEERPAPNGQKERTGIICSGCDREIVGRVYHGRVCRECREWQIAYSKLLEPIYAGVEQ